MNSELDSLGFELDKARRHADNYAKATGTDCRIIGIRGEPLYETNGSSGMCAFCRKVQVLSGKKAECSSVHLYGSYQAERFGGKCVIMVTHSNELARHSDVIYRFKNRGLELDSIVS